MPSRMSCSLTTTSAAPIRSMIESRTRAPARDHVHAARDASTGTAARSACVERSSHSVISRTRSYGDPGVVDGHRVVRGQILGDRRHGRHRTGEPDQGARLAQRDVSLGEVERGLDVGADRGDLLRPSAGRRRPRPARGAARSSVRSRCPRSGPRARGRRRRRTRSSRRRCPRPGRARRGRSRPVSSLVAPVKENSASWSPEITSGSTPRMSSTPRTNSSRFSASREAEVATKRTRSAPCSLMTAAYSRQAAKVRSSASGASRPVRSTPWPSRTMVIRRSSSTSSPVAGSASATRSRMEFVPQSTAATRVTGRPPSKAPARAPRTGPSPTTPAASRSPRRPAG